MLLMLKFLLLRFEPGLSTSSLSGNMERSDRRAAREGIGGGGGSGGVNGPSDVVVDFV
jgi:hypothetical protein